MSSAPTDSATLSSPIDPTRVEHETKELLPALLPDTYDAVKELNKRVEFINFISEHLKDYKDAFEYKEFKHDSVRCFIRPHKKNPNECMIGFFHNGTQGDIQFSADFNFTVTNELAKRAGFKKGIEPEAVYDFAELTSSYLEAPGGHNIHSGRSVRDLGIGPQEPLRWQQGYAYSLKKISDKAPVLDDLMRRPEKYNFMTRLMKEKPTVESSLERYRLYRRTLESSLERYRRYDREERFDKRFVSRTLLETVENNDMAAFRALFHELVYCVHENERIYLSDVTLVLHDLWFHRKDLRRRLKKMLVTLSLSLEVEDPLVSEYASKMVIASRIGEVVLVSPECLEASGTGGLAIYMSHFAHQLASLGLAVTLITPMFYPEKKRIFKQYNPKETGTGVTVKFKNRETGHIDEAVIKHYETFISEEVENINGAVVKGSTVRMVYLENDEYFNRLTPAHKGDKDCFYGNGPKQWRGMRMLSLGSLFTMVARKLSPSIAQLNDWSAALTKMYFEGYDRIDPDLNENTFKDDPRFSLTKFAQIGHQIKIDYTGRIYFDGDYDRMKDIVYYDLGFDGNDERVTNLLLDQSIPGKPNLSVLAAAISLVDKFITVSHFYMQRIMDEFFKGEFSARMVHLFKNVFSDKMAGISNGFRQSFRQKYYYFKGLFDKAFVDVGHEEVRRKMFADLNTPKAGKDRSFYDERKTELQRSFGLPENNDALVYSMLHRIDDQKGHQLLLAEIWNRDAENVLVTQNDTEKNEQFVDKASRTIPLSKEQVQKIENHPAAQGKQRLRAIEIACILNVNIQFIIAGSAAQGEFYDLGFMDVQSRFPEQVAYRNEFIREYDKYGVTSQDGKKREVIDRYRAIYTGSAVFGMPSMDEPGGISQLEAHAGGIPCLLNDRDGLKASILKVPKKDGTEFSEAMDAFNPVTWLKKLDEFNYLYTHEKETTFYELRYKAITQDNRWLKSVKKYIDIFLDILGLAKLDAYPVIEICSAIHQAKIKGEEDAADRLVKAGYTPLEAYGLLKRAMDDERVLEFIPREIMQKHFDELYKIREVCKEHGPLKRPAPQIEFLKSA
ncbi:MAG: glycogen/starch synthase [Candidatus Omnitrophica bacterium]|nr:glycogen/starch synthase [Candidatus Omnitrophota bacterium]